MRRVEIEPLLAEQLAQVTDKATLAGLRHFYADCALLRDDGFAAVERYAASLRGAITDGRDVWVGDLEGLAMSLALVGRSEDALEVDAISLAFRRAWDAHGSAQFWDALRSRHLDHIRTSATHPPDPAAFIDLARAVDRASSLAHTATTASQRSRSD